MGRRAGGVRSRASCVAGERRALSRARRRRASGRALRRGRRAPGSRARTGPAGSRDARPAGGDARGGWRLRRRDCQLRGGAEARAVGRRRGASGARARARRPGASARGVPDAVAPSPRPRAPIWPPPWRCECPVCWRGRRHVPLRSSPTCAGTGPAPGLSRRCAPGSSTHIPTTRSSPRARVPRAELAQALSRDARPAGRPGRPAGRGLAARAAPEFADLPRAHPAYAAAAQATAAGVLDAPVNGFAPTRAVSGQEVLEAVSRSAASGRPAGRARSAMSAP